MGNLSLGLISMLNEGIGMVLDSASETMVEVSTAWIAQELNKRTWMGKGTWTDTIIESFLDNLKSNLQTAITTNIIQRRIGSIQWANRRYFGEEKLKQGLNNWKGLAA